LASRPRDSILLLSIDFPKPARRGPFIDIDHIRKTGKVRWFEESQGGLEDSAFQRPSSTLHDVYLGAANLGLELANAKELFPPLSDGAAEILLAETDHPIYQFHWELKKA
jgi:hypothetical protein